MMSSSTSESHQQIYPPLDEDAILFPRTSRPFPPSSVLAALPTNACNHRVMPLLRQYLVEPFDNEQGSISDGDEDLPGNNKPDDTIDNPDKSTLTKGQHQRYLKLVSQESKPLHHQREFRKLSALVKAEQQSYLKARNDFFHNNAQRFLRGFVAPVVDYARWHAAYTQNFAEGWRQMKLPLEFGAVRQVVSLLQNYIQDENWAPNKVLQANTVTGEASSTSIQSTAAELPRIMMEPGSPSFLSSDKSGTVAFAQKHQCSVVVTLEALEAILTLDDWKILMLNEATGLRLIDLPIPQPTLPRTSLTKGMEETLRGEHVGFAFTSLTLNNIKGRKKPHRILVRVPLPHRRSHVHLEYFPERGKEYPSSQEMAVWILDSLVASPSTPLEVTRVSTNDWKIKSNESVSVAHALSSPYSREVLQHWNKLLVVLNSLETLLGNDGAYLLNGRADSLSLHRATETGSVDINLEEDFRTADAVKMNTTSLLACARPWEWYDSLRAPDTFPTKA